MSPKVTGRYRNVSPRVGRGGRFGLIGQLPQVEPIGTMPATQPESLLPEEFVEFRRNPLAGIRQSDKRMMLERRAVSIESVYGSLEERIVYKELLKRKIPFDFQSSLVGPRRQAGAIIADFLLLDRPTLIWCQGSIWHRGISAETRDILQIDQLTYQGYETLQIWDYTLWDEALTNEWFRRYIDVPVVRPITLEQLRYQPAGRVLTLQTRLNEPPPRK